MIAIGFSAALAALDLLIKARIENQEQEHFPRMLPYTKDRIKLHKYHNDGFPFGFMREHFQMVQMIALTMTSAVAGILAYLTTRKGARIEKLGLALVLGGALSNLYDRLVRKYVVDYFSIEIGKLKQVIFNLGDIFIFLGSIVFWLAGAIRDARS